MEDYQSFTAPCNRLTEYTKLLVTTFEQFTDALNVAVPIQSSFTLLQWITPNISLLIL